MENTIENTMNAWKADAEKFTGDKAMFWAGMMSTMIGVISRSGVSALSVNIAVAERCKEEYDRIIFERDCDINTSATDKDASELMLIAHMDAYAEARKKYEPLLEKMAEALELLLDLPIAATELSYLRRGVGLTTKNAAWLVAEQALQEYREATCDEKK